MSRYFTLFWAALREQARAERAFLGNFWFGMLTKLVYNIMFVLFIDQLFARIGHLAGFSKNDFLCMYFVSQAGFYVMYYGIFFAMQALVESVRNGNFDLLLLKPVPHRSFLYVRGIQPIDLLLTATPSMIILAALINWSALHISLVSVALGLIVWVSGIVIGNTVTFALALPVFIKGEATDLLNTVFYSVTSTSQIQYSRMPMAMKIAAVVVFPQIIIAGATTEVLLQKVDPTGMTIGIAVAALLSALVAQLLWRIALRNYTSVSS